MNIRPIAVLLVEDDPADAASIQAALPDTGEHRFQVEWVTCLSDALKRLGTEGIEVVLLDLTLPDGQGIEAFDQVHLAAPRALILVLSGSTDEEAPRLALQRGAHDYLAKGHIDAHWLPRALRYVIERKVVREGLRDSEARFRAMSDASPLGVFVSDAQGDCTYTNAAYQKISGLTSEQTLGTKWSAAVHPDDRRRVLEQWHEATRSQEPFETEFRFLREDDSVVWTRVNGAPMRDGAWSQGHVQTVEDITERKSTESVLRAAEEAIFEEKERAQVTLNSIGDAVLSTDLRGKVTYMNPVAETMTGWTCAQALGRPIPEVLTIIEGKTRDTAENPALRAITENRTVALTSDCVLIRRDGSEAPIEDSAAPIHNRDGHVIGAVIVFHDVSKARVMALKMSHQARHDFLTGLPNRVLLNERLEQAIGLAHRHRKQVALLFLDLDKFKHINDSLGHSIGDEVLQAVAACLNECVRATDAVCRQGGDEFVILLTEIESPQDAAHVANKVLTALTAPQRVGGRELHVTVSIGISVYPDDGATAETLTQNADMAMYHAKTNGRNGFQFFRAEMNTQAVRRQFVEGGLRRALRDQEFLLHYQPQINLDSGAVTGAEALLRWQDPDLGLVYPGDFVPIAEECGLIVPIGQWVLREACRQARAWLDGGLLAVPVAVNISALELRHEGFLESVALILKETALPARYLELELTETVIIRDAGSSASVLESLRTMGVQLAIDDFGTGYSSLSYLKRMPINTLKIDQSFVRDIGTPDGATIVAAVIGMGKNLNQRVIAEGVETGEQLAFLRARQCEVGQGFHFSRPLPAQEFALWLEAGTPESTQLQPY